MSVYHLNNTSFLQRVASALKNLNTLDFETMESAFTRLIKDFSYNLNEIVDVYKAHNFSVSAGAVLSLKEKILEKNNKEFLNDVVKYIEATDLEFKTLSIAYGELCLKCLNLKKNKNKNKKDLQLVFSQLLEHEDSFKKAIENIRSFSQQKLEDAQKLKVTHLEDYKNTFEQLSKLADLTWVIVQTRLFRGDQSLF